MKKVLAILILLALAMSSLFCLSACGETPDELQSFFEKMDEGNYEMEMITEVMGVSIKTSYKINGNVMWVHIPSIMNSGDIDMYYEKDGDKEYMYAKETANVWTKTEITEDAESASPLEEDLLKRDNFEYSEEDKCYVLKADADVGESGISQLKIELKDDGTAVMSISMTVEEMEGVTNNVSLTIKNIGKVPAIELPEVAE